MLAVVAVPCRPHLWRDALRRQQLVAVAGDEGGVELGAAGGHEGGVRGQAQQEGDVGGQAGDLRARERE